MSRSAAPFASQGQPRAPTLPNCSPTGPGAQPDGDEKRRRVMQRLLRPMKARSWVAALGVTSLVVVGAVGTAGAKDEWFVLSEQTIKATDPSVRITAEDAKWIKEDVKDVKLSVEGGGVGVRKVI